jgi:hypothetical protein
MIHFLAPPQRFLVLDVRPDLKTMVRPDFHGDCPCLEIYGVELWHNQPQVTVA